MYTKLPNKISTILYSIIGVIAAWILLRHLLPVMAPFLISFALAAFLEPTVDFMCRRRWPRSLAAGMCTAILLLSVGSILFVIIGRGVIELGNFAQRMSGMFTNVASTLEGIEDKVLGFINTNQGGLGKYVKPTIDSLDIYLQELPVLLSGKLLSFISGIAGKTPGILLFTVTCGIGVYFISASYPNILSFAKRQIPENWLGRVSLVRMDISSSLGNWIKAQLALGLITFVELIVAFIFLKQEYAIILSLFIAIIDALPVLGTGTILVPWGIYEMLTGNYSHGLGLVITYFIVTIVRNLLQPQLIGDSMGIHPVVTLVAVYAGFCACGVFGMLVFPIFAVTVKQLNDREIVRLWKKEEDI